MKYENEIKGWAVSSLLAYVIYETMWCVMEGDVSIWGECDVLAFDFLYCSLFSLTSLLLYRFLSNLRIFQHFNLLSQGSLCLAAIVVNFFVAFCFEKTYNLFADTKESVLTRKSLYIFCVLATLMTLVYQMFSFYRVVLRQQKEFQQALAAAREKRVAEDLQVSKQETVLDSESETICDTSENLRQEADAPKNYRERILVAKGDVLVPLSVSAISFVRKEDSNIVAYTSEGEGFRLSMTMADLESQLNPDLFFRLNRQYLANFNAITKISLFFGSKLIVRLKGCDDDEIVVSKERSILFKQWLDR